MAPNEARENIGTVMKDMDLDKQLVLERNVRKFLCMQMKVDVQWLKDNDIMDYSLLLGISYKNGYDPAHVKFLETPIKDIMKQLDSVNGLLDVNLGGRAANADRPKSAVLSNKVTQQKLVALPTTEDAIRKMQEMSLPEGGGSSAAGAVELRRSQTAFTSVRMSGLKSKGASVWQEILGSNEQTYSCGIIDMLQTYTVQKQMERTLKMIKAAGYNAGGISSMNSNSYADRFLNYMFKVLIADEVLDS